MFLKIVGICVIVIMIYALIDLTKTIRDDKSVDDEEDDNQ
jgi:hypothetical protein